MPIYKLPKKLVDWVPPAVNGDDDHKHRRPTVATEETHPSCSDDELSEVVVVALSDSDDEEGEELERQVEGGPLHLKEDGVGLLDLSMETLLQSSSSSSSTSNKTHLLDLLEENQRALEALLASDPQRKEVSPTKPRKPSWMELLQVELQQTLPGVASLLLYCMAHASTYEFVSNLAYEAVEQPDIGAAAQGGKARLYATMMVAGCVLARLSGLVWSFVGAIAYKRVKLIYHNRVRLGAKDARWLSWLQHQGENVLGVVHLVAYYLCYIAVVYFVGQLAITFDQRDAILAKMPSTLYQQEVDEMASKDDQALTHMLCPAQSSLPDSWFGNETTSEDPLGCNQQDDIWIFGPEDDQYFYRRLSKNSYDHFFGQDYETAFFDSAHQITFYVVLAAAAMVTMKSCLKFSFWAGW